MPRACPLTRRRGRPVWTRYDDASVSVVGSWEAVCSACARGHLQPTVLFYEHVPSCF